MINSLILFSIFISVLFFAYIILKVQKWSVLLTFIFISIFLNFPLGYDILGVPLTTQKLVLGFSLIIIFIFISIKKIKIKKINTKLSGILLLFLLSFMVSSFKSINLNRSYKSIISLVMIIIAVHLIVFMIKFTKKEKFERLLFIYIPIIISFLLGIAIYQFLRVGNIFVRLMGTFENPNEFGAMVLMTIPLTLTMLQLEELQYKILGIITGIFSLTAIYLTYSRGTYLATIFLFLVIIVGEFINLRNKDFNSYRTTIAVYSLFLISLIVIYNLIPESFYHYGIKRYHSLFRYGKLNIYEGSIEIRYKAILTAIEIFKENIIFGVGPGNYVCHPLSIGVTENTYLQVLSESGVIGFSIFMFILYRIFIVLKRNFLLVKDEKLKLLNKNLLYGFITFLFLMGTNDFLYDINTFWIWVTIIVALPYLYPKLQSTSKIINNRKIVKNNE